jgi:hypothetical protein
MVLYVIGVQAALYQSHPSDKFLDVVHPVGHERDCEKVQDIETFSAIAVKPEPVRDNCHENAPFGSDFLSVTPFDITGELYAKHGVLEVLWRCHQLAYSSIEEMKPLRVVMECSQNKLSRAS